MRPAGTPAELDRRRRRAVALMEAGESSRIVARILGVTTSTLRRWRRLSRRSSGLAGKPPLGPTSRLTDPHWATVAAVLKQGTVAHGWPNHLWTCKRVATLIQRHFGVRYHPAPVYRLLVRRLHGTNQKPQKRAREGNLKEVERWIADD